MDLKGNGVQVSVEVASQSDEWLIDAAREIAEAAEARGLAIPAFIGDIAVTDTMEPSPELEGIKDVEPVTRESLSEQLPAAVTGYNTVMDALNGGKRKNRRAEVVGADAITEAFDAWLTAEKLTLLHEMQEDQPEAHFTLVATPNVVAKPQDIIAIAEKFGQDQPYQTYVWEELYNRYSAEQLSGTTEDNEAVVNFALIPSTVSPRLEGTVVEQRAAFAKMQTENPDLRVPSVLDAVTYWSTLRAQGEDLADGTTFDRTYIRHFDLPEQRVGGWLLVPYSYVGGVGGPALGDSYAGSRFAARVAVG